MILFVRSHPSPEFSSFPGRVTMLTGAQAFRTQANEGPEWNSDLKWAVLAGTQTYAKGQEKIEAQSWLDPIYHSGRQWDSGLTFCRLRKEVPEKSGTCPWC